MEDVIVENERSDVKKKSIRDMVLTVILIVGAILTVVDFKDILTGMWSSLKFIATMVLYLGTPYAFMKVLFPDHDLKGYDAESYIRFALIAYIWIQLVDAIIKFLGW